MLLLLAVLALTSRVVAGSFDVLTPVQHKLSAVRWGRYFGKQDCKDAVNGSVTWLAQGDVLCGPPFRATYYKDSILVVPDFFYALETVESQGVTLEINSAGCSKEDIFTKLVATGARAIVAYSIDNRNSVGEFVHGKHQLDPEIFDKVPLLSANGAEILRTIPPLLQAGQLVTATVSCDEEQNPMLPFLTAMSIAGLVFGAIDLISGMYGAWGALLMLRGTLAKGLLVCLTCTLGDPRQSPTLPSSSGNPERLSRRLSTRFSKSLKRYSSSNSNRLRDRARTEAVQGQALVLLCVSAVRMTVGLARFLGLINIYTHSYILGDTLAFWEAKSFFLSGLAGINYWCVFLVGVFWLEMTTSLKKLRPLKNIFRTRKLVLFLGFLVSVLPDLVNSSRAARNTGAWSDAILWMYTVFTALSSAFFLYCGSTLLGHLKGHLEKTAIHTNTVGPVERFALHMSVWLRIFALTTAVVIANLVVMLPTKFIYKSAYALVVFYILLWACATIQSLCLIMGLLGPSESENRQQPRRREPLGGETDLARGGFARARDGDSRDSRKSQSPPPTSLTEQVVEAVEGLPTDQSEVYPQVSRVIQAA